MDIQRFFNQGPRRVIDSEIHGESQECFEESRSPVVDHSAQAEANRATDVSTRHQGPANPTQPRSLQASEPGVRAAKPSGFENVPYTPFLWEEKILPYCLVCQKRLAGVLYTSQRCFLFPLQKVQSALICCRH